MRNEIDALVQAEMAGAGLNADQERFVHALVKEERERKGGELDPVEAQELVRAGLVKIMDIETGADEN